MASKKIADPSNVREWAKANLANIEGLPEGYTVARQGRLHPAIRAAFNKANKGAKYAEGVSNSHTVTVKYTVLNKKGGKTPVTKSVNVKAARAALVAAKVEGVGERGRLKHEHLVAFAKGEVTVPEVAETE